MASQTSMISQYPWDRRYRISSLDDVLTPALVLYPEVIASNIERTLQLLGGDANRWRVHIKTAKLAYTVQMLIHRGIRNFKCATTLELRMACENGATDVLLAYPVMGANAIRAREIADEFPHVHISVLAESVQQVRLWRGSRLGIFLDINPGMNRTGIELGSNDGIAKIIREIHDAGLEFRGLHYYDGQYGAAEEPERTTAACAGYDRLLTLVAEVERNGFGVPEVITAGTPTFFASLTYERFRRASFLHRVSPGTIVYQDATSLAQLPRDYGYAPAAMVLARVVSRPHEGIITCDAGHKAVSADAGVPTCVAVGHPELSPLSPSEEHVPIRVTGLSEVQVGDVLYLIPRHVCPTVNNFDLGMLVRDGAIESIEKVSARGREGPLLRQTPPVDAKGPATVETH